MGVTVTQNTPLFLNHRGKCMSRVTAHKIIRKACKELGIGGKVATHSLRKAFVTKIYELTGHDIIATQKYSRHKNLTNLQYYIATTETTELINQLWT
jgi:site-specific recombinase XerD